MSAFLAVKLVRSAARYC